MAYVCLSVCQVKHFLWRRKFHILTDVLLNTDVYHLMCSTVSPSPLESLSHREFLMETQILKKLRHRHLITLFAVCTSSTPFYIITELMEKGNLLNFLRGQNLFHSHMSAQFIWKFLDINLSIMLITCDLLHHFESLWLEIHFEVHKLKIICHMTFIFGI